METRNQQIARGRELLGSVRHAAMATVNEDGTPHNTPFMFMHDAGLKRLFWGSHPESEHSKNILRNGQLFVVLYDAYERGGLYIKARNARILLGGAGLEAALAVHNGLREMYGQSRLPVDYYRGASPQRMWSAEIVQFWVNGSLRGDDGNIVRDTRAEVTAHDLLHAN